MGTTATTASTTVDARAATTAADVAAIERDGSVVTAAAGFSKDQVMVEMTEALSTGR